MKTLLTLLILSMMISCASETEEKFYISSTYVTRGDSAIYTIDSVGLDSCIIDTTKKVSAIKKCKTTKKCCETKTK